MYSIMAAQAPGLPGQTRGLCDRLTLLDQRATVGALMPLAGRAASSELEGQGHPGYVPATPTAFLRRGLVAREPPEPRRNLMSPKFFSGIAMAKYQTMPRGRMIKQKPAIPIFPVDAINHAEVKNGRGQQ